MKRILLVSFVLFSHFRCFSQSVIGLKFGSSIDSVYQVITTRYGEDYIERLNGGDVFGYPKAKSDTLLYINKPIYIFDNTAKTAKSILLSFQKSSKDVLSLNQICFLISELPNDWADMLNSVFKSYYDYIAPYYARDCEIFINDYGLKCFRFGKAKYTKGTWYGVYNIVKSTNGYRLLLIYSVPQI